MDGDQRKCTNIFLGALEPGRDLCSVRRAPWRRTSVPNEDQSHFVRTPWESHLRVAGPVCAFSAVVPRSRPLRHLSFLNKLESEGHLLR